MPESPSFQEINRLFYRFHGELESIIMDKLGDEVSYNLLSCVFEQLDETQEEYHNKLAELYGKDGEDNG
ncbi:hypothetical protein [Ruminococcus sp.]|uniref:hypothetical protein n=1 Tax=Ruminococcus sp. TaxID=41978 RepID=UPI0025F0BED3|nr:hypothetical protein [Ruminococcus sp.]MBQ8965900.1 hypothetical protein [Ruminococcus sp.]